MWRARHPARCLVRTWAPCGEDIVAFLDWVDWTGISLVVLLVIGFGLVWLRFRNRD
jgi:hypothetical protein